MKQVLIDEAEKLMVNNDPFDIQLQSNDDPWRHYTTLKILRYGTSILEQCDGGEPEDNSFGRDWWWVPDAIAEAYQLGLKDGKRLSGINSLTLTEGPKVDTE